VNSLPKTVTRQRRDCDLNPGRSAPESSTLTTRLPSRPISIETEQTSQQMRHTGGSNSALISARIIMLSSAKLETTGCKAKHVGSLPGYPPSRLLIIVNWSVN